MGFKVIGSGGAVSQRGTKLVVVSKYVTHIAGVSPRKTKIIYPSSRLALCSRCRPQYLRTFSTCGLRTTLSVIWRRAIAQTGRLDMRKLLVDRESSNVAMGRKGGPREVGVANETAMLGISGVSSKREALGHLVTNGI